VLNPVVVYESPLVDSQLMLEHWERVTYKMNACLMPAHPGQFEVALQGDL
jgi:hypothetical protein